MLWSGAMQHLHDVHKIGNEEGLAAKLHVNTSPWACLVCLNMA